MFMTKTMECEVAKKEHFRHLLYGLTAAPKLQRPPEIFVPSMEKTLFLKEQPRNGLRASSKAILT
jgi:hypothetical protein